MGDDGGSLVRRAQRGDVRAFEALVELHQRSVFRLCYAILRSHEEAQDAAQEAFVVAWRRLPALSDPLAWRAWLRRIAVSRAMDAARRQARCKVTLVAPISSSPDHAPLVDARDQIEFVLASLPPPDRALLALRYYLDLEVPDAAAVLGVPVGTAKSRLHRAIARLRPLLEDRDEC